MNKKQKCYWHYSGTYEKEGEKLDALIPVGGSVDSPKQNPKLERYRKMVNAYSDLYQNGGWNPCRKTAYYFPKAIYWANRNNWDECFKITEPIMDKAILLASKEQGFLS